MAKEFYDGKDTYIIWGQESSYGVGSVSNTQRVSKLQDVSLTMNNNFLISQGVGEGANATSANLGNFDVTGSLNTKPTEFHFLTFGSGSVSGAGSTADPYKIISADNVGYSGTFQRTGVFELGSKAQSNHSTQTMGGVTFNTWTVAGNQGEELTLSADFTAGSVASSTSLSSVSGDGRQTFTFTSGSVGWSGDVVNCTAFSLTSNWASNYPREVFDRFGKQPTKGVRRYNWTLTLNKQFDNTAGFLDSQELLDEFFGASNGPASSGTVSGRELSIHVRDGTPSGSKNLLLQFENSYFNDVAQNPSLEGGLVSVTVNGFSLAGKTESGDNVAIKWWDES